MAVNPKVIAIPRAVGAVTAVNGQMVTVKFADIPANPESIRGQERIFQIDLGSNAYRVGNPVVASWNRSVRLHPNGAMRVQGKVGGGCYLRPLERAADEPELKGWLPLVKKDLAVVETNRVRKEHGKPTDLDSTKMQHVVSVATTGDVAFREPESWLPVPCQLPIMDEEWSYNESYLRIGYVSFTVDSPVEEIKVREIIPAKSTSTLRSRTPIQKDNWHAVQEVTISLTLYGTEAINQILLPLYRMHRRAPFQPIFNTLLFEQDITAIAITNIQTATLPGFPNALKAVVTCWSFNWQAYFPSAKEFNGMDWLFCYPLLKLWLEKDIVDGIARHVPFEHRWNGRFRMFHPDEDWLREVDEFGVLAERAQRINKDQGLFEQALRWRDSHTAPNFEGFVPRLDKSAAMPLGAAAAMQQYVMEGDVARAQLEDGTQAIYIRVHTEVAALTLTNHPDLIEIIKGKFALEVLQQFLGLGGKGVVDGFGTQTIDKEELRRLIGANDPTTRELIKSGHYVFVVYQQSDAWRMLIKGQQVPAVNEPGNERFSDSNVLDAPSFVVEQVTVTSENIMASLQPRGHRTPTHQYMGSNATFFTVVGTLKNQSELGIFKDFFTETDRLAREFRGRLDGAPFGGYIIVDNELFQFAGVRHVLPLTWNWTTVQDFPGALKIEMNFVEFDATQRRREVMQELTKDVPQLTIEEQFAADEGNAVDLRVRSEQDKFPVRYLEQRFMNNRLRAVELYPDLELPTHSELAQWVIDIQQDNIWDWEENQAKPGYEFLDLQNGGTGWFWGGLDPVYQDGQLVGMALPNEFLQMSPPAHPLERFADPDFYCAPSQVIGEEFVEAIIAGALQQDMLMSDPYGAQAVAKAGEHLRENKMIEDPQGSVAGAQEACQQQGGAPSPVGASTKLLEDVEFGQVKPDYQAIIGQAADPSSTASRANSFTIPNVQGTNKPGAIRNVDSSPKEVRINTYGEAAARAAKRYNIPPDLFFAIIETESDWKAGATSRQTKNGRSRGLAQVNDNTAKRLGVSNPETDLYDPTTNLYAAARILSDELRRFGSFQYGERLAIAAYNAGSPAVRRAGNQVPDFPETQNYVLKVIKNRANYKSSNGLIAAIDRPQKPQVDPESVQLARSHSSGYGYKASDLFAHLPPNDGRARRPDQNLNSDWFFRIDNTGYGDAYYVIKPNNLDQFTKAQREGKYHLPLVKIPERLPGKDAYGLAVAGVRTEAAQEAIRAAGITPTTTEKDIATRLGEAAYTPPTIRQAFHDPPVRDERTGRVKGGRDMFHDMRRSMNVGRLLGAFPSFYVAVVDGGRSLRVWRLFDHVYGMFAITRIAVHRTRLGPIETAVVGFSNMYGHLTAQANDQDRRRQNDTRGIWTMEALYRGLKGLVRFDEETVTMWARHLNSLMLRPGARLHIRMGYGSDASKLPVVFNGVITEVPLSEGELEVVALSDGVELTNDIAPNAQHGSIPVTRLNGLFGEGLNPRELVMSFLAPVGVFDLVSNYLGQANPNILGAQTQRREMPIFYFNFRNQYGIEHFGRPIRNGLDFDDGEVGVNIYNPEYSTPFNKSSAWDNSLRIFQFWRWGGTRRLIGINMNDATPWRIFETTRYTVPDYILYPHPFELRSTLFMGKGWFPIFTEYRDDLEFNNLAEGAMMSKEQFFNWKPFQQVHLATSDWNLLGNEVRADATNVVTKVQATGTYNGWLPGSSDLSNESSFVMMLDEDIYDEFQKMKVVESGLYTTINMKLTESNSDQGGATRVLVGGVILALGIGLAVFTGGASLAAAATLTAGGLAGTLFAAGAVSLLEGPLRSFFQSRRVMDYFAAMVLKDHVKDMYQGPLVMLGNGYIKPFDYVAVADHITSLNGLCEAKTVDHTMSLETGFCTAVSPDCIADFVDFEGQDLRWWLQSVCGHMLVAMAIAYSIGHTARQVSPAVMLRGVRRLQKFMREAIRDAKATGAGKVLDESFESARAASRAIDREVGALTKAVKMRNSTKIKEVLDGLFEVDEIKLFADKFPKTITAEIEVQKALRGIPGTGIGKTVKSIGKGIGDLGVKVSNKLTTGLVEEAAKGVADAKAELTKLNVSPDEVNTIRKAIRAKKTEKIAEEVIAAVKKLGRAEVGLKAASTTARVAKESISATRLVKNVLKGSLSKSTLFAVGSQFITVAIGGLADYIVRWAIARQCLTLYPLKVGGKILEAGIDGHRGAVAGDPLGGMDSFIQNIVDTYKGTWYGSLIPIVSDLIDEGVSYRAPQTPKTFRA